MNRPLAARWLIAAILAAALLQTAALARMITDRAALLRDGREVVLATAAIDPRDLFRGHYTILAFDIGRIDKSTVTAATPPMPGEPVYVTLTEGEDGYWRAQALHNALPTGDAPVIAGTFGYDYDQTYIVHYPFDRYFAPKLRALELEDMTGTGRLGVILALDDAGRGAIKGLRIDDRLIYEEPLY